MNLSLSIAIESYFLTIGQNFDFIGEASDQTFAEFFNRFFDREYQTSPDHSHASGSKGYAYYCSQGIISKETQAKVEQSYNMRIYREIIQKD